MSEVYTYTGKTTAPDIVGIQNDVAASAMIDKAIMHGSWHQDIQTLTVHFTDALVADDKTILDGIVTNNS